MALSATDHNTNNSCSASDDLWDNLASDTTDDEQEELPYDGIHECYLIPNTDCNEVRSSEEHLDQLELNRGIYIETDSKSDKNEASCEIEEIDVFSFSEKVSKCSSEYEEETLQSFNHEGQSKVLTTIIPDVLLRHFNDDNLLSQCQFIDHETIPEISIAESSDEILISKMSCTKQSQDGSEPEQEDDLGKLVLVTDGNDNQESNLNSDRNSDVDNALSLVNCEKENPKLIEECTGQEDPLHDCFDKENPYHIYGIQRRLSSNDIKYGQGQVHYKLPDFSKVPPKVKIPKGNGNIKPMPIMKRARSSPNLTGPSVLIKDILDSMQPLVEPEPSHTSELLHVQVQEVQTEVLPHGHQAESDVYETSSVFSEELEVSKNIASPKGPTEGEKMSEVLKEQALQLKAKIFQNLKLCLESLELNYLSTKEQHRDLQLQMYRTGSRSAGEFDLDRQVEGQIFRLGMLLEDIQEEINKNTESLFPSRSSPTSPTATNISHQTATEDAYSLLDVQKKVGACLQKETNNLRSCMGSLNRTTDPERQLCEQDTADVAKTAEYYNLVKTSTPSHFYPGAHHRIRRSEVSTQTMDLELKDQHTLLTYQTFESEKKELSNNTRLSIFIQENSLNLDFPDCKM
ncbi:protein AKNAD1 [Spea bombifrons]|uniref:protein AKNAD1 n=1 Tax=Spea bombifrons TaxID=233779 RepID=UPI00234A5054|nr:protein AKNAD1 [Spea bombifrons]